MNVDVERTTKVAITLDEAEARDLISLLGNFGDSVTDSPRRTTDKIYWEMTHQGITPSMRVVEILNPEKRLWEPIDPDEKRTWESVDVPF